MNQQINSCVSDKSKYPSGSEWRRWDLHVHTPGTNKNDQYSGKCIEEKWDNFYKSISEYVGDERELLFTAFLQARLTRRGASPLQDRDWPGPVYLTDFTKALFTRTADIPIRAGRQARFRIDADAMSWVGFRADAP